MDLTCPESADATTWTRAQLSNLYGLFVVSMMMFDGRTEDEIIKLARTSVPSVSSCRIVAAYLVTEERLARQHSPPYRGGPALDAQIDRLDGLDGPVTVADGRWARAFVLRDFTGPHGYLVVSATVEPPAEEMFLVKVLVQQTAAALANTSLHRVEREHTAQLRVLNDEREAMNKQLTASVATLRRQRNIHQMLTGKAAAGGGEAGIAESLHQLTQMPVVVEDQFGNMRTWAGPGPPDNYAKPSPRRQEQLLSRAAHRGGPVRDRGRLVMVIRPRHDVLGVIALIDPDQTADHDEITALEQAATVLAVELAHQRSLTEVEQRLRRDLVDDLVSGTDVASAYARSAALGHDLHGPHHVAVLQWRQVANDAILRAVWHASVSLEIPLLAARHAGGVVLLTAGLTRMHDLYESVSAELGTAAGSIGVGGRSKAPADLPRSFHEAQRAFGIRRGSNSPDGVTLFDQLGLYRLLGTDDSSGEITQFVREWLGPLLDYDERHHADLVRTLSEYLEHGGSYDETAQALLIHRSTLRYRLKRIRAITGRDLGDVDTRLNLHVATRALSVLHTAR
jgi:sugar diacid utilization regulator